MTINSLIRWRKRAMAEVSRPTAQKAIESRTNLRPCAFVARYQQVADFRLDPLHAFLGRRRAQIPTTTVGDTLGVIFLILYAAGKLPGLFALPAGLGDVLVGVLAPVVAIAYRRGPRENADLVFGWNLFGLADFVVAVTAGFLTSPSPFQLFAFDLPNELVSRFPLVLIPVFVVPVSALLHLASLTKLRRGALRHNRRRETARAPA
jgi:hypothetical protein